MKKFLLVLEIILLSKKARICLLSGVYLFKILISLKLYVRELSADDGVHVFVPSRCCDIVFDVRLYAVPVEET